MSDPTHVTIAGIGLVCRHCAGGMFAHRSVLLDTTWASLFGVEWLNQSADVYQCARCGCLHHFVASLLEENAPPSEDDDEVRCMSCAEPIPPGADRCGACGWTYRLEF